VLIGSGPAAALSYAALAQAPGNLFRAGVGIDFCPELAQSAPPCEGEGTLSWSAVAPQRYRLQPAVLPMPWHRIGEAAACSAPGFAAAQPRSADLAAQLDALLAPPATANAGGARVDDLPLVELPAAAGSGDFFVVLLSGDGGWADIDKDIGGALNQRGIPVVGWNTLQYFWNRKTPESAGADLRRVIAHYAQAWNKPRVVLVGFSLGADVLPFMITRLPPAERARVQDIALLSLSHGVDFEFHVTAWLGSSGGDTHQVEPELRKIAEPVLCVYGTDDDDTLCKEFKAANVTTAALPGDHHYGGDFQKVTALILRHAQPAQQKR
jgi:type IV secretory pathway VirJ component